MSQVSETIRSMANLFTLEASKSKVSNALARDNCIQSSVCAAWREAQSLDGMSMWLRTERGKCGCVSPLARHPTHSSPNVKK